MTAQQSNEPAPPATAKAHDNPAGKPIPQAVLVYHESAHSIVFRDHLRRQQSAIRRTSSHMESSTHGGTTTSAASPGQKQLHKQYTQPVTENDTPISRGPSTILEVSAESDIGYESGGNSSTHSARSGEESSSSVASGGSRSSRNLRRMKSGLTKPTKKAPAMQTVVIANFQPVIEPLETLDLNSSNLFEPLLDADPWKENATLEMTDSESEVVELLKNEKAVVKTIRNADWTAFLHKFKPNEEGGGGTHEHHPAHQRQKKEPNTKKSEIEHPFNSFVTSTSLLPPFAKKMRKFMLPAVTLFGFE